MDRLNTEALGDLLWIPRDEQDAPADVQIALDYERRVVESE